MAKSIPSLKGEAAEQVTFFVAGTPVAQPRPRAIERGAKVHIYNPPTADVWKQIVSIVALRHIQKFEGAYQLRLVFQMPRPERHYRSGAFAGQLKPGSPSYPTTKPDVDNLAKAVIDALVDSGRVPDDKFLVSLVVSKTYAKAEAGCLIKVSPVDNGEGAE